jgi:hypothetical protein
MKTASKADVLLVGSLPFSNADASFRAVGRSLNGHVGWIPDGEFGERKHWTPMLPEFVYSRQADLDETLAPPGRNVQAPPAVDGPPPTEMDGFWNFRIKPGRRLRFDDLLYGGFAVDSYEVFKRLRGEGVIAADVRFQVSLPSPHSGVDPFFEDADQWPEAYAAYVDGMKREVAKILAVAPASDLVFQWDCANEIVDLGMGTANAMKWYPKLTVEEKFQRHVEQLGSLGDAIPEGALLGFHWCYGTWGGWPAVAMPDLEVCVRFSNEAVQRTSRHVDYVHMPVLQKPEESFFAPLADLEIRDTTVFLGMVHHTDGIDDFRRRRDLARKYLPEFGIGSVCGYGRVGPDECHDILELHAQDAAELQT